MLRIAEYFKGKRVFVTGATGFLGQPLVEKILFVCPEVSCIHVLIRPKKKLAGQVISAQQRLERELYGSTVFDRLRAVHGDRFSEFLREKLRAVAGDISMDGLGIEPEVLQQLQGGVDVVINSAAVVSFDAPVDEALEMNVRAAERVARFAGSCPEALLVHVSTAYVSGADRKTAAEEMYHAAPPELDQKFPLGQIRQVDDDLAELQRMIESVRQEAASPEREKEFKLELVRESRRGKKRRVARRRRLDLIRQRWEQEQLVVRGMAWARQRGWNDTYTYTKALGEHLVLRCRGTKPLVILRPSIIESSLSEPQPGWLDGLRMADPLITAIGKGRLKSLPLNPEVPIDLIPVDMVVNALLASIVRVASTGGREIYQVATGDRNPIHLGEMYELILEYFEKNPMLDKSGKPIRIRPLKFPNPATFRLRHRLESVPLSTAEKTLERLPLFESTQKVRRRLAATRAARQKLYYYGEIYQPYLNLDCRFQVDRALELFGSLKEEDQKRFNFDVTRLNWRHYIQNVHIPGVKKYILKMEGVGTMELEEEGDVLPVGTIPELIAESARRHGGKIALQMRRGQNWERFSFRQVCQRAEEAARQLHACGCEKGDRVLLFSENQPKWGIGYLSAVTRGVVVVPVDAQTWHKEVWEMARFTEARAILASQRCFGRLTPEDLRANEESEQPVKLLNVDQFCAPFEIDDLPRSTRLDPPGTDTLPPVQVAPDDLASIVFTQGPAVDPKGAVHTHRNFLLNLAGVNHYLPIREDDALLSVLPLWHTLEFTCGFLMPLYGGATVTYSSTLKPRAILERMRETGTTCMLGVPAYFALIRDDIERRILKATRSGLKSNLMATSRQISKSLERRLGQNWGRQLFSKVHQEFGGKIRLLVSGGSQLGGELYEEFRAFGMPIYEGYGLTETAPVLTVNPINRARSRSAGRPLPGVELRLDFPDRDGIGEIVVRTPSLMKEYYRNPEATRRVMEDGWFHTGDLGWVDADGYLYVTGRVKDVIVTGAGKNVYPVDLEAHYRRELPEVIEVCVVGVKAGLTEELHAVMRPDEGRLEGLDRPGVEQAISKRIQALARELPSYHRFQQVHFRYDELPRRDDGSIDRQAIAEWVARRASDSAARDESMISTTARTASDEQAFLQELSRMSGVPVWEIEPESDVYLDLGLDSLQAIELLLFAEHRLALSVPDEQAARMTRVGEFLAQIEGAKADKSARKAAGEVIASALPHRERSWLDRAALNASYATLRALFRSYFRLEAEAVDQIPKGRPYILAANHSSHMDTGAVLTAVQLALGREEARRLHVLGARDYFFESKLKGWLVSRLLNVVPIERKETSLASLRLVKSILGRGESVLIYPEGTRTRDGNLGSFKPGLALMAVEAQAPIVPTFIRGTFQLYPAHRIIPRPGRVHVRFGAPLTMDLYPRDGNGREDVYRRIARDVEQSIAAMKNGVPADSPGG